MAFQTDQTRGMASAVCDPRTHKRLLLVQYGEDVAGRVGEPCDVEAFVAEDALRIHGDAIKPQEFHPLLGQLVDGNVDVIDRKVEAWAT